MEVQEPKFVDILKKYRVALLSGITIIVVTVLAYFYISDTNFNVTSAINAVPLNAAFIIETQHFDEITDNLKNENEMWTGLTSFRNIRDINYQVSYFDSLIKKSSKISSFVSDKPVILSAHVTGKDRLEFLFAVSLYHNSDEKKIKTFITDAVGKKGEVAERAYDNNVVYDVRFFDKDKHSRMRDFSFSFNKGLFFISYSAILVENSIRQLGGLLSLSNNPEFKKITSTMGKSATANVYFNYKYFPKILSAPFLNEFKKTINGFSYFANWSAMEMKLKDNALYLTGKTFSNDSAKNYFKVFEKQAAQKFEIPNVLPDKTATFLAFGIENFSTFFEDYKVFLKKIEELNHHNREIERLRSEYEVDLERIVIKNFESEMALIYFDESRLAKNYETYFVARIKNADNMEEALEVFHKQKDREVKKELKKDKKKDAKKKQKTPKSSYTEYGTGAEKFKVYKMPFENFAQKLFGNIFSTCNCDYYTFVDNYIVFGRSSDAISVFLDHYVQKRTLANDKGFINNSNLISSKANLWYYSNILQSTGLYTARLTEDNIKFFNNSIATVKRFEILSIQFSSDANALLSNVALLYNSDGHNKTQVVWETKLDTVVDMRPQVVINHTTKDKEIFVQDAADNIYLVSNAGKILWKTRLSEKIMSEVYQIDYMKNGKLQYLFNTENKLFLIDRNGNNVEGFPIKLKSPATNALTVFDYDKSKEYRIFIACQDKRVLALDKHGKMLDSWQFDKTQDNVYVPVQYFNVEGKDYIVFADNINIYIVNRKGETRVKLTATFPKASRTKFFYEPKTEKSRARLVTTNTSGEVHFIYFDGSVKKMVLRECAANHCFEYADITGDGLREFIFLENNTLESYDRDKNKIFSYTFKNDIVHEPKLFSVGKRDVKIGIVSNKSNQIFLFNSDGTVYKGFPLSGESQFTITNFAKTGKFNLIVGSKDNYLYNYQIQ